MFETHKLNEKGFEEMKAFKTEMSIAVSKCLKMMECKQQNSNGVDYRLYAHQVAADKFKQIVEEAVYYGAKAIASKPENFSEIVDYPEMPRR